MTADFRQRLARAATGDARPDMLLLDGATGSELQRRGVDMALPLWGADAARRQPDVLLQIHLDYLHAGAEVVTAHTFRTSPYTLRKVGRNAAEAADLTARAVACARDACARAERGWVAGSMPPLEDCYAPQAVPPGDVLRCEHAAHARNLAVAGADLLLVETMNTAREAHAAAEAALATGLPVLVSLVPHPAGDGDLLSGEELEVAWAHLRGLPIDALLVNCAPCDVTTRALERMHWPDETRPIGAYANAGHATPEGALSDADPLLPADYAACVRGWLAHGARIVGGCCTTTPAHIEAVARLLKHRS